MEILDQNLNVQEQHHEDHELQFHGDGAQYFGIVALNVLFTVLSLGLYYPWAKTTYRKYLWNESELNDSRFTFNGTGKEVFKGFLLVYLVVAIFYLSPFLVQMTGNFTLLPIIYGIVFLLMIAVLPLAIYGSFRYRISRTSWRGIYFDFDGNYKDFAGIFYLNAFFTIITFGIFSAWMRTRIMKYLLSHTTLGQNRLDFHGDGATLFGINLIGGILMYPTLFMYIPIWMKDRFNFTINNLTIEDQEKRRAFHSTLQSGEAWKTLMVNGLLLIVTLGLAFPWTVIRKMRMYFDNIVIPHDFDLDELSQADSSYSNATGDEIGDFLDIGIDF